MLDRILKLGKACTFSEMNLYITYKGEDVKNAIVTRSIEWDKEIIDTFQTDEFGKIRIPSAFQRSSRQLMPILIQFSATQTLSVYYQGRNYEVWTYTKMAPKEFIEFNGSPFDATCELTDKSRSMRLNHTLLDTNCVWSADLKIRE